MEFELKERERLDDLLINNLKIIQSPDKFCFGIDAVLLSGFINVKKTDRMIDLGTGNGIIPFLIYAKKGVKNITGLDIQQDVIEMARRSAEGNDISSIEFVVGDLKEVDKRFKKQDFDVVTSNPPYIKASHGILNCTEKKSIARHEVLCKLEDVIVAANNLLKPNGKFFMVHRALRLAEIFNILIKYRLEPKRIRFVHSKKGEVATLVLIEAVKHAGSEIIIEKPLIIYNDDGTYTEEMKKEYSF